LTGNGERPARADGARDLETPVLHRHGGNWIRAARRPFNISTAAGFL
jgi:hypothetical protein